MMRHFQAKTAHDAWFRSEVQHTLDRIERSEVKLVDHDEMFDRFEAYAAERMAQREAQKKP